MHYLKEIKKIEKKLTVVVGVATATANSKAKAIKIFMFLKLFFEMYCLTFFYVIQVYIDQTYQHRTYLGLGAGEKGSSYEKIKSHSQIRRNRNLAFSLHCKKN